MGKGVLLVNLGSPDSPSVADVRRYLREFLMDGRVLDMNWLARVCVVHFSILPSRPKQSAEAYQKIWTDAGSPLIVISGNVQARLQKRVGVPIELAMRYQNPSIPEAVRRLVEKGVDELLLIPLFPHYAMSSFESAVERVKEVAARLAPGVRGAGEAGEGGAGAPGPGDAFGGPTAVFRTVGLHRRSGRERGIFPPEGFRSSAFQFSRPAGASDAQVRSDGRPLLDGGELLPEGQRGSCDLLSGAVLQDDGGVCSGSQRAEREILHRLSIASGPRPVAQTLHGLRTAPARRARGEEATGDVSCLCGGLSGNAGRNRDAGKRNLSGGGRS